MKCGTCGRELKEDSKFCDQCGTAIPSNSEGIQSKLDTKALLYGILFSVIITILIMILAKMFKFPLIFGGLFLPFFWWSKKLKNKN